ncbi:hypothetical protein ACQP3J_33415, partial [Escherichia coli]
IHDFGAGQNFRTNQFMKQRWGLINTFLYRLKAGYKRKTISRTYIYACIHTYIHTTYLRA